MQTLSPAALIRRRTAVILVGILLTGAAPIPDAAAWAWPIAPPRTVLRPFEAPATPYSAGHRGIDLAAIPGTTILAPAAGIVYFAGRVVDRDVITIEHEGGFLASFEPVLSELAAGDTVTAGQVIGTVDRGGHCANSCLHFGVRLDGEYLSPLMMLGGVPRAVLLPLD